MKANWIFWALVAYVAYGELKDWYQSWQLKKNEPKPYEQFLIDNKYLWTNCFGYERFYQPHIRTDHSLRNWIHVTIQRDPALLIPPMSPEERAAFLEWFGSPAGYAFTYCNNVYRINSKELFYMREDPEVLLRQSMTEAEFFQFFLSGVTSGPDVDERCMISRHYWSVLIKHHGRRAMKEGFSPKALYAFLSGIGPIKEERTRRFFSRLASFVRARIPNWGDINLPGETSSKNDDAENRSHSSHLS